MTEQDWDPNDTEPVELPIDPKDLPRVERDAPLPADQPTDPPEDDQ